VEGRPEGRAHVSIRDLVGLRRQGRDLSFLPRQPVHSQLAGVHASRLRGRGLDFHELRAYVPGDDVRDIDWKVTARTRRPYTRIYSEERNHPALLLIDQRVNMFFGSQLNMKSVTAAHAAALVLWRILAQGDQPGAIVFNDDEQIEIRPARSEMRAMSILRAIEKMNRSLRDRSQTGISRRKQCAKALDTATKATWPTGEKVAATPCLLAWQSEVPLGPERAMSLERRSDDKNHGGIRFQDRNAHHLRHLPAERRNRIGKAGCPILPLSEYRQTAPNGPSLRERT